MVRLEDHHGRVLISRSGAIGDLLACEPAIRAVRMANPKAEIILRTRCMEAMQGCPHLDGIVRGNDGTPAEHVVLDGAYESQLDKPRQKAICEFAGLEYPGPSKYWLTKDAQFASDAYRDANRPLVVVCPYAHWGCRLWEVPKWHALVAKLKAAGCRVLEVALPRFAIGAGDPCFLPWWGAVGVIAAADCWVGVDSGPMWVALGLGIPTVGLFGPTTGRLVSDHPNLIPISSGDEWDGCHHRGTFPKCDCVCGLKQHPGILRIGVETVSTAVLREIEKGRAK
jgi:ADP-heptose:LPS heptosyltransferase